ncbi:SRPBCC family protein [Streptomyces sp. NBC_00448]|uniref:SRPBCC family protein n=1 Tax=Streptomyces sp. NBC_00448 TaxID=2903652 RepID=UPI002E1AC6B6
MWNCEYGVEVGVTGAEVWARYTDLDTWPEWYGSLSSIRLDGPFAAGSEGVIEQSMESGNRTAPVAFTLTDVTDGSGFTLLTRIGEQVEMRSVCAIAPAGDGVRITHRAELDGPGSEQMGAQIGAQLEEALRTGVDRLAKVLTS